VSLGRYADSSNFGLLHRWFRVRSSEANK
jgi:hypothetical protein